MDKYDKIEIDYHELPELNFKSNCPFILCINWDGIKYEFLIKVKEDAENLLVLGSGSYDPDKFSLPVFQRHAWIDDFNETVIYYNDPTLYLSKITLGWGHGTAERHYLKDIAEIIERLIAKLSITNDRVFFFGSSAGGFMSLMLAGLVKGSTAIVNNPQTFVLNFWPRLVEEMLRAAHPNLSRDEIVERFSDRMDVLQFYKKNNYIPEIHYMQNVLSDMDVKNHLIPFISGLKDLAGEMFSVKINVYLYADNKGKAHNPVGKKETLEYINRVIKSKY